jgi:hypothetical protein
LKLFPKYSSLVKLAKISGLSRKAEIRLRVLDFARNYFLCDLQGRDSPEHLLPVARSSIPET